MPIEQFVGNLEQPVVWQAEFVEEGFVSIYVGHDVLKILSHHE